MARLKQGILRKYAKAKKPAKLAVKNTKYTYTTKSNSGTTKKYAYTKRVLINGKYRYYYA